MGLDMYACKTNKENIKNAVTIIDERKLKEVYYWRKHPNLHGWFENLYRNKGGDSKEFNCNYLEITKDDINELEKVVNQKGLPYTTGYFFGESEPERIKEDLEFIDMAKEILNKGESLVYYSWW